MGDIVIVALLLIIIAIAIVPTIKHFKGQGGCCGGGSYKPKKKKLEHVIEKKEFYIEGRHCENCSNRVMEKINDIPGVSAEVKLKKNIAIVSYARKVDDAVIIGKIEEAGYSVKQ